ncbi:uncharacterized protein SPAPADRAFT_134489 [Spathaspora passalidarum NRRL Y-27907]|uniref:Thioredoxin domain-containing protein n=1 Tax=Spathaspora passalidarum (strain NRRL Y-27907 / 11-Y1) TaxID=619300 RepID=G3AI49_SPAPN|nr:uncharacterized protein SPAPADRAFT_134489 [Spathaspora passalidarum NRRL Y-27907]EGW34364.1 hypothetical protein SPAPADRAFT_134489 [Spathaspora passalidarum NRRL Y-27907]
MFVRTSLAKSIYPTRSYSVWNWFRGWARAPPMQHLVYPPPHSQFTTGNRIIDTWITETSELYPYLAVKQPLLLNFTYATEKDNKITQHLFDILSQQEKYPLKEDVYLVNILCDSQGGRELMMEYCVGSHIPCLVVLKKQLVVKTFPLDEEKHGEQDIIEMLKQI